MWPFFSPLYFEQIMIIGYNTIPYIPFAGLCLCLHCYGYDLWSITPRQVDWLMEVQHAKFFSLQDMYPVDGWNELLELFCSLFVYRGLYRIININIVLIGFQLFWITLRVFWIGLDLNTPDIWNTSRVSSSSWTKYSPQTIWVLPCAFNIF